MVKQYELTALVRAEDASDLLTELAEDERVQAVTLKTGDHTYLVPEPKDEGDTIVLNPHGVAYEFAASPGMSALCEWHAEGKPLDILAAEADHLG